MIRSFVAIPLPTELQQKLSFLQRKLLKRIPELRPVPPENLHLSLMFFGEQPQEILTEVATLMQSIGEDTPPFSITLKGLGSFSVGKSHRVVWLGVESGEPLLRLQSTLVDELCGLGLPREPRPFRPHLTLGRLRNSRIEEGILASFMAADFGRLDVVRLVLFSSRLTREGAIHHPLRDVPLGGFS